MEMLLAGVDVVVAPTVSTPTLPVAKAFLGL